MAHAAVSSETFLSIFSPLPRSPSAVWTLWSRSMGGLSQDQDASYRAALCCLREGRRLRGFLLILRWCIWEGPLLMIMMPRPAAERAWLGQGPHSHSHSCTGDIKGWPVEAPTGQTALAGWIVGLCEFISTIVGFFSPFPERNVSNVIVACVRVHIRVCEFQNIPLTKWGHVWKVKRAVLG